MKRFHANEKPEIKMFEVKKRVPICYAVQLDEEFNVGTSHGIAHGGAGDYLLMDGSSLSIVRENDFETIYELVKPKKVKTPERVAKKSSKEIYQKEEKTGVKKVIKPIAKKVKPVAKKAVPKKKATTKKKAKK